jgi:tetratricopeptide (TPR) repeat protein
MLRLALEQTQRSRGIALRILKTAGASDQADEESVTRAIRFTDEILERSLAHARTHDLDAAVPHLEDAIEVQRKAKERFDAGDLESAMRLTLQARGMAKNAVRGVDRTVDRDSVQAALTRTDEALGRLREALAGSDNPQAQALYERALQRQTEAWDAFESRQSRKALALTRVATNLAENAMRQLGHDDG